MSVLEDDLVSALKSLVGNRMRPRFPLPSAKPTWPAIRYTIIDCIPDQDIYGFGDDDTAEPRIQLDVAAVTYEAARVIRLEVIAVMHTFSPPAILNNSSSGYDTETETFREMLDFTFHGSS